MFLVSVDNVPFCLVGGSADDAVTKADEIYSGYDKAMDHFDEMDNDWDEYVKSCHEDFAVKEVSADEAMQIFKDRLENKNTITIIL